MSSIVFDMDGVLFATEALSDRLWETMMTEAHLPELIPALQQCRGRNHTDTRAFFATQYPDVPYLELEAEKRRRMLEVLDREGMPLMPGVEALLQALQSSGWQIALATSTSWKTTQHHLQLSGLHRYFSTVITGDQITHGKPHPEIYSTACEKLGSNPTETYAVEDSENGVKSAHAAGLRVLMVPDQVAPTPELRAKAEMVLPSLMAVQAYFSDQNLLETERKHCNDEQG